MIPERLAAQILYTAIREGRASELLDCLMKGGSCTIDAMTGELVLVTGEQLNMLVTNEIEEGKR